MPDPDTHSLFVRFSFLMSCPWDRNARSNVCAVVRQIIWMLLPMFSRIISVLPSTMVSLFAARASSWRSPNIPGTSDSVVPCVPSGVAVRAPTRSLSRA
eukprot:1298872-Pyramimonas_sp.AAC.1